MPLTAEFIDECRKVFGVDQINDQIRRGMRGDGCFWANENGFEIGSRPIRRDGDV